MHGPRHLWHGQNVQVPQRAAQKTITMTSTCKTVSESESPRQRCNAPAYWLSNNICKTVDGNHKLCYDRNVKRKDFISLDGHKTELKHKNMRTVILIDCTDSCSKTWPGAVRWNANCDYTAVGISVPVSKNQCKIDYFQELKELLSGGSVVVGVGGCGLLA